MSLLTKIFIVLMVVFSIAFTMTTISVVSRTHDWKTLAEDYQTATDVTMTHMRNLSAAHAAEKTVWLDTKRGLDEQIRELGTENVRAANELAAAREDLGAVRAEKDNADALARQLASELQVAHEGWMEQKKLYAQVETRNLELERRNLDLNDRVNKQSAQIVVLAQELNQAEQRVNILREELGKVTQSPIRDLVTEPTSSSTLPGITATTMAVATPIRGHIVEVDSNLATISVGSSDGVKEGMVFVIYRGSDYVGDLQITDVHPNLSAGRIARSRMAPRAQDMVADEPALGFAR